MCVGVAVVFDLHPLLTTPIVLYRKWIKKALLFERSEFQRFPIFCNAQLGTRRALAVRPPSFAYFSWRSKKSERLPGRPRPTDRRSTANANQPQTQTQTQTQKNQPDTADSSDIVFTRSTPIPIPTFPLKGKELHQTRC